jgi:hypothetical protein
MNDALRTDVFVRFKPEAVACACIHLATRKQQLPMPPDWWAAFGCTTTDVDAIVAEINAMYSRPKVCVVSTRSATSANILSCVCCVCCCQNILAGPAMQIR